MKRLGLLFVLVLGVAVAQLQQDYDACKSDCSLQLLSSLFEKTKECSARCQPVAQNNKMCVSNCIREARDALRQQFDTCMQNCEQPQMQQMQQVPPMPAQMPPNPLFWGPMGMGMGMGMGPGMGMGMWGWPSMGFPYLAGPPMPPPMMVRMQPDDSRPRLYNDEDLGESAEVGDPSGQFSRADPETRRSTARSDKSSSSSSSSEESTVLRFLKSQIANKTDSCTRQCAGDMRRCVQQARRDCASQCGSGSQRKDCMTACMQTAAADCQTTFDTCQSNCQNTTALWAERQLQRLAAAQTRQEESSQQSSSSSSEEASALRFLRIRIANKTDACTRKCAGDMRRCVQQARRDCAEQCGTGSQRKDCMTTCMQTAATDCKTTFDTCQSNCQNATALWAERQLQRLVSARTRQTEQQEEEAEEESEEEEEEEGEGEDEASALRDPTAKELKKTQQFKGAGRAKSTAATKGKKAKGKGKAAKEKAKRAATLADEDEDDATTLREPTGKELKKTQQFKGEGRAKEAGATVSQKAKKGKGKAQAAPRQAGQQTGSKLGQAKERVKRAVSGLDDEELVIKKKLYDEPKERAQKLKKIKPLVESDITGRAKKQLYDEPKERTKKAVRKVTPLAEDLDKKYAGAFEGDQTDQHQLDRKYASQIEGGDDEAQSQGLQTTTRRQTRSSESHEASQQQRQSTSETVQRLPEEEGEEEDVDQSQLPQRRFQRQQPEEEESQPQMPPRRFQRQQPDDEESQPQMPPRRFQQPQRQPQQPPRRFPQPSDEDTEMPPRRFPPQGFQQGGSYAYTYPLASKKNQTQQSSKSSQSYQSSSQQESADQDETQMDENAPEEEQDVPTDVVCYGSNCPDFPRGPRRPRPPFIDDDIPRMPRPRPRRQCIRAPCPQDDW